MLLSHKYKFIFVKTTKTAGTSIEVELSKVMGGSDIVTPIFPPVEGHVARNYEADNSGRLIGRLINFGKKEKTTTFYNHMEASRIRELIGVGVFDSYFKFCVEREPVSKCISHYSMLKNSPDHSQGGIGCWDEYVERGVFPIDVGKYTDSSGRLLVDKIYRYEDMGSELKGVFQRLNIPLRELEVKAKSGFREQIWPSLKQKKIIYDAFSETLLHCPYEIT